MTPTFTKGKIANNYLLEAECHIGPLHISYSWKLALKEHFPYKINIILVIHLLKQTGDL
jgi:hypothetical protein